MNKVEEFQLKVMCMNAASGDLTNAMALFAWTSEPAIEAEVERRVQRILAQQPSGRIVSD